MLKQNKTKQKKLSVLVLARDVCILESFAIRVHGHLFTLSAGKLLATWRTVAGGGTKYKAKQLCNELAAPCCQRKPHFRENQPSQQTLLQLSSSLIWFRKIRKEGEKKKKNPHKSLKKSGG